MIEGQPDLFGQPERIPDTQRYPDVPGERGVFTQIIAADYIKPCTGRLHAMIREHLLRKGAHGATRQEISDDLGLKLQTVCGRVRELVLAGELKDTDATRGERPQRVVVIA